MAPMNSKLLYPSSTSHFKYDVFLSFNGDDTINTFADHLYSVLNNKGIVTFWVVEELKRGKTSALNLSEAIEKSRFAVVILSRKCVSSMKRLEEIAKIVECKKLMMGQTIFPVFYDVEPSMVKMQIGHFGEVFAKHEKDLDDIDKVNKWRKALIEIADTSKWSFKDR